jgi:hypothetical protein
MTRAQTDGAPVAADLALAGFLSLTQPDGFDRDKLAPLLAVRARQSDCVLCALRSVRSSCPASGGVGG